MCQSIGRGFEPAGHNQCGRSCSRPATRTVVEEIQLLEDHKRTMQDQLGEIDKKIAALKTTKES